MSAPISVGQSRLFERMTSAPQSKTELFVRILTWTTDEQVRQIESAFCALPGKVDTIHDLEWGTDVSVENLSQGFTHCFLVTFLSEADRATYLPHPEHKAFGKLLGPHLDKVVVVDYWTQ